MYDLQDLINKSSDSKTTKTNLHMDLAEKYLRTLTVKLPENTTVVIDGKKVKKISLLLARTKYGAEVDAPQALWQITFFDNTKVSKGIKENEILTCQTMIKKYNPSTSNFHPIDPTNLGPNWTRERMSEVYDKNKLYSPIETYDRLHKFISQQITDIIKSKKFPEINIIDGGCGSGLFLKSFETSHSHLARFHLTGFDFNDGNISECQNNYNGIIQFSQGNLLDIDKFIKAQAHCPTFLVLSGSITRLVLNNGFEAIQVLQKAALHKVDYLIGGGQGLPLLNDYMAKRLGYKKVINHIGQKEKQNAFFYERLLTEEILQNKISKIKKRNKLDLSLSPNPIETLKALENKNLLLDHLQIDFSFSQLSAADCERLALLLEPYQNIKLTLWHWNLNLLKSFQKKFPNADVKFTFNDWYLTATRNNFASLESSVWVEIVPQFHSYYAYERIEIVKLLAIEKNYIALVQVISNLLHHQISIDALLPILKENAVDIKLLKGKDNSTLLSMLFVASTNNLYSIDFRQELSKSNFMSALTEAETGETELQPFMKSKLLNPILMKLLSTKKTDVNKVDKNLNTILHCAAEAKNKAMVKYLIDHHPFLLHQVNFYGETPLHCMMKTEYYYSELCMLDYSDLKLFRDNLADFSKKDNRGKTPLHTFIERVHRHKNPIEILEFYYKFYPEVFSIKDNEGKTPISQAILTKDKKISAWFASKNLISVGSKYKLFKPDPLELNSVVIVPIGQFGQIDSVTLYSVEGKIDEIVLHYVGDKIQIPFEMKDYLNREVNGVDILLDELNQTVSIKSGYTDIEMNYEREVNTYRLAQNSHTTTVDISQFGTERTEALTEYDIEEALNILLKVEAISTEIKEKISTIRQGFQSSISRPEK